MHKVETITLEDLKKGSDKVLQLVYEDNRTKFLNFARRYNLPEEDLIDAYQDAYIAFYDNVMSGKIKSFTSSISTYIISVGKYIIFDKLKKNTKKVTPDFDVSLLMKTEDLETSLEYDTNEITEEQRLLYKYFNSLGKKCQELLDMFYYRGFTINDIIENSDYSSENVVKSAKSRCMKTLKERILNNE